MASVVFFACKSPRCELSLFSFIKHGRVQHHGQRSHPFSAAYAFVQCESSVRQIAASGSIFGSPSYPYRGLMGRRLQHSLCFTISFLRCLMNSSRSAFTLSLDRSRKKFWLIPQSHGLLPCLTLSKSGSSTTCL